jgi:hypothetical protein
MFLACAVSFLELLLEAAVGETIARRVEWIAVAAWESPAAAAHACGSEQTRSTRWPPTRSAAARS